MIIDCHIHTFTGTPGREYFPEHHRWAVSMQWAYGEPPVRDPNLIFPTLEERMSDPDGSWTIKGMDSAGVDACFALPVDYGYAFGQEPKKPIDEIHRDLGDVMKKWPGRIFGFAGPDPRRPDAVQLFERAIKEYGLVGLKVIPSVGIHVWDERLYALYQRCDDWGLPVEICTQCHWGGYDRGRFDEPLHLGDVAADFPDMKVVALHSGYPFVHWFDEVLAMATRAMNMSISMDQWVHGYDRPGQRMLEFWPNARTDEKTVVRMFAKAKAMLGAHRMLFGTDHQPSPRFDGPRSCAGMGWDNVVQWYQNLPKTAKKYGYSFNEDEVELILGKNAARLIGLEKDAKYDMAHKYDYQRRIPQPFPKDQIPPQGGPNGPEGWERDSTKVPSRMPKDKE